MSRERAVGRDQETAHIAAFFEAATHGSARWWWKEKWAFLSIDDLVDRDRDAARIMTTRGVQIAHLGPEVGERPFPRS